MASPGEQASRESLVLVVRLILECFALHLGGCFDRQADEKQPPNQSQERLGAGGIPNISGGGRSGSRAEEEGVDSIRNQPQDAHEEGTSHRHGLLRNMYQVEYGLGARGDGHDEEAEAPVREAQNGGGALEGQWLAPEQADQGVSPAPCEEAVLHQRIYKPQSYEDSGTEGRGGLVLSREYTMVTPPLLL